MAANRAAMPNSHPKGSVVSDSLAQAIGFLSSGASGDISGSGLPVNGGTRSAAREKVNSGST